MPRIRYVSKNFGAAALAVIREANAIIAEYAAQGYDLTLRQLYYQFVSRDLLPNRQSEYKRLGDIINDARLAGPGGLGGDRGSDAEHPSPAPLE